MPSNTFGEILNEERSRRFRTDVSLLALGEFGSEAAFYGALNLIALLREAGTTEELLIQTVIEIYRLSSFTMAEKNAVDKIMNDAMNGETNENQD